MVGMGIFEIEHHQGAPEADYDIDGSTRGCALAFGFQHGLGETPGCIGAVGKHEDAGIAHRTHGYGVMV